MVPALRPGQLIIASNLFTKLSVGQIVVIKHERLDKIKRVKDIRKGQLYLLGDNARRSIDSRSFGWLPLEYIVGRIIWPRV
jgi:type IV secretory pathway protease TraF